MSDDLLSPFFSALCFVNASGSQRVTFLSSSFPLFFASFLLLEKKRYDFTFQVKKSKTCQKPKNREGAVVAEKHK